MTDLAAIVPLIAKADCWLTPELASAYVGAKNMRQFNEKVKVRDGFPKPHPITGAYRKSELTAFMERTSQAA